jgi:hypothetical protein
LPHQEHEGGSVLVRLVVTDTKGDSGRCCPCAVRDCGDVTHCARRSGSGTEDSVMPTGVCVRAPHRHQTRCAIAVMSTGHDGAEAVVSSAVGKRGTSMIGASRARPEKRRKWDG